MNTWTFRPIDSTVNREDFDCGNEQLNTYLKRFARQNHDRNISRTFVALQTPESTEISGFYSICMAQVSQTAFPAQQQKRLPRYPIPAMRLSQLAVSHSAQGQGLGKIMLMRVLETALTLAETVGIYAVIVDAIDEPARAFYQKYGFITFVDEPMTLFLPIRSIPTA
jgi:GNAT superfamily N-acetyltransferase